jgi:KDO2-lipid IV(A) lauroyltransferase
MTTTGLDRREGGTWTRAQRLKNGAIAALVGAGLAILPRLPRDVLRGVGRALAAIAYVLFGRARRLARRNLERAYPTVAPRDRRALLFRTYATLGAHLGDAIASLDPARPLDPLPIDEADLALLTDRDRGVLFVSAHLGPWERVAATLVARGVPLTVIARESYDARLDRVYTRLRDARGVVTIYRGDPGAAARIVRALRRRRVLGVPMDLATRAPSVASTFLGLPAMTAVGPARIALRMEAKVVVGSVAPDARGKLGITCTAIDASDLSPDAEGERALTRRIDAELSRRILALPAHWPWMHPRFAAPFPDMPDEPRMSSAVVFSDSSR